MKWLVIIIISFIIFLSTFISNTENTKKDTKKKFIRTICGLAAVLGFIGPYIVEFFETSNTEKVEYDSISENETERKIPIQKDTEKQDATQNNMEKQDTTQDDTEKKDIVQEDTSISAETEQKENEEHEDIEYVTFIGESHTPSSIATKVELSGWEKGKDFDIAGQTYGGGIKITIYNMFSALDGNSSSIKNEIISEIHYALNTKAIEEMNEEDQRFVGKFVIGKDTNGSPSTTVISILLDGEEIYNSGEVNCYSLDIEPFDVRLTGKKEMVIKTVCQHRGNPFIVGVVSKE